MEGARWLVIHVAHDKEAAGETARLLEREGFLTRVQPLSGRAPDHRACYEIRVLRSEASEARALLIERGY